MEDIGRAGNFKLPALFSPTGGLKLEIHIEHYDKEFI